MNMKKHFIEFVRRGFIACGFGPLVLAVVYLVLKNQIKLETLSVSEVCIGIFSLYALAFIAGGINVIYQIERIPLMVSLLIHGVVLYMCYLATYLLNDWLQISLTSIMVFTAIFIVGYLLIWAIIYSIVKKDTAKVNELLKKNS